VLLPATGEVIAFENNNWTVEKKVSLNPLIVDGLGVGDVGPIVFSDRRALSEAGIVVVVIPRKKGKFLLDKIEVISRGFVFMKEADEVVDFIQDTSAEIIEKNKKLKDYDLKRKLESKLSQEVYKIIRREPVVLPVILDS
jgi:ribonuclease J